MWLIYASGGLDFYIRWWTEGELANMEKDYKISALPMGIIYGFLTLVVVTEVMVYISST